MPTVEQHTGPSTNSNAIHLEKRWFKEARLINLCSSFFFFFLSSEDYIKTKENTLRLFI